MHAQLLFASFLTLLCSAALATPVPSSKARPSSEQITSYVFDQTKCLSNRDISEVAEREYSRIMSDYTWTMNNEISGIIQSVIEMKCQRLESEHESLHMSGDKSANLLHYSESFPDFDSFRDLVIEFQSLQLEYALQRAEAEASHAHSFSGMNRDSDPPPVFIFSATRQNGQSSDDRSRREQRGRQDNDVQKVGEKRRRPDDDFPRSYRGANRSSRQN